MRRQTGFFDADDRLNRLSDLGDQLEAFEAAVEFEAFRPELNAALTYSDGTQGGRPPFDPVMMFKILVIQTTNNLSDERAEFLINDRLSFMRFLGFGLSDRVPDARMIWLFREKLTKAGAIGPLFERFDATLRQSGYIAMSGQIVDASLIAAPRPRNTQDEKKAIKDGRIPDDWKDKPAKLRQKEMQLSTWTERILKLQGMPLPDKVTLEEGNAAAKEFMAYMRQFIEVRRRKPGNDLLSALIVAEEQGDCLTAEEIAECVVFLSNAGLSTTRNLIGSAVVALLKKPQSVGITRQRSILDRRSGRRGPALRLLPDQYAAFRPSRNDGRQ